MSSIPKPDKKPKYNKNDAFVWVDSQWEKFMTEQKEHKAKIKQLQDDLGTCTKNFQEQRKQLEDLVSRVPSSILNPRGDEWRIDQFNRNRAIEDQVSTIEEMEEKVKELFSEPPYIYESPDGGKTTYRRKAGDYDNKVEVDKDGNPISVQLEMFPPNDVY